MKKQYITPQIGVLKLKFESQLLTGSNYSGKFNAPAYDFDEDEDDD